MSGHRKWSEVRKSGGPESEERVRRLQQAMREAITLAEVRRAREYTQAQLAETLQVPQGAISRLEHQTDMYLSTLRRYVEAMGGQLELRAIFPDGSAAISSIGSVGQETEGPTEQVSATSETPVTGDPASIPSAFTDSSKHPSER